MTGRMVFLLLVAALGGFAASHHGIPQNPPRSRGPLASRSSAPASGAPCRIKGSGDFIRPDDRCTPGTFDVLSKAQACVHKERPSLSATEKRRIFRQYGFSRWTGRDGEIDHRVPFFLGGRTEEDNLWPEQGGIPNTKDKLEFEIHDRVCDQGTMTVAAARAIFRGDWANAYRRYVGPGAARGS